jgi:hypothetical protein
MHSEKANLSAMTRTGATAVAFSGSPPPADDWSNGSVRLASAVHFIPGRPCAIRKSSREAEPFLREVHLFNF